MGRRGEGMAGGGGNDGETGGENGDRGACVVGDASAGALSFIFSPRLHPMYPGGGRSPRRPAPPNPPRPPAPTYQAPLRRRRPQRACPVLPSAGGAPAGAASAGVPPCRQPRRPFRSGKAGVRVGGGKGGAWGLGAGPKAGSPFPRLSHLRHACARQRSRRRRRGHTRSHRRRRLFRPSTPLSRRRHSRPSPCCPLHQHQRRRRWTDNSLRGSLPRAQGEGKRYRARAAVECPRQHTPRRRPHPSSPMTAAGATWQGAAGWGRGGRGGRGGEEQGRVGVVETRRERQWGVPAAPPPPFLPL